MAGESIYDGLTPGRADRAAGLHRQGCVLESGLDRVERSPVHEISPRTVDGIIGDDYPYRDVA